MQLVHLSKKETPHVATGVRAVSGQVIAPSLVKDRNGGNKWIFQVKQLKSQGRVENNITSPPPPYIS